MRNKVPANSTGCVYQVGAMKILVLCDSFEESEGLVTFYKGDTPVAYWGTPAQVTALSFAPAPEETQKDN